MKRILLCSAAMTIAFAAPLQSQPIPQSRAGATPPSFQQMLQQQQQQQAEREANDRAQVERDLARMTPEAREQYQEYARERVQNAMDQVDLGAVDRGIRRDVERNGGNLERTLGGNDVLINDPARSISNQQFGQEGARGITDTANTNIQATRDVIQTSRPLIVKMAEAGADVARERQRLILESNPNMSQVERDRLRYETDQAINAARNINQRLDEADFRMRDQQQRVRESEDRIAAAMERMANEQGQNPATWQIQAPVQQQTRPRPLPLPPIGANLPPVPPPAVSPPADLPQSPPPTTAGGTRRPVQRGQVPSGDPYAGLRVPRSQGGTGAETPQSRAAAERQRQQQADAASRQQAEANAERTERSRQAAMDRAQAENEEADRIFGAAEREREARAAREQAEFEEWLQRQVRPGNVGGGFVDWEPGSPLEEQMAGGDWPDFELPDLDTPEPDPWQSFELGGTIIVAELVPIYDGYDWLNAPVGSSGRSLSAAGTSLSSAGTSLSAAGTSLSAMGSMTPSSAPTGMLVDWGGLDLAGDPVRWSNGGRPPPGSYAEMLAQLNEPRPSLLNTNPWADQPWATSNHDLASALFGPLWSDRPYQVRPDPYGRRGRSSGGPEVANLFDTDLDIYLRVLGSEFDYVRQLLVNDHRGLDRMLAQPFNVLLTWGANANDLDLHMTGPLVNSSDRFHIYYAARGELDGQPFAELIKDCICTSGSEVILTSALNTGSGVYRVSVFNFGDQSATSTNLADESQAVLRIVRGGTAVSVGNGTTINGGVTLLTVGVPSGQPGNTWVAAEVDPNNGSITAPGMINTSSGSANVE